MAWRKATGRLGDLGPQCDTAVEKVRKYQHLMEQVKELTRAGEVEFLGFPVGTRRKWYKVNDGFLDDLGLSSSRQTRIARCFSQRALLFSLDILHIFTSKEASGFAEDRHPGHFLSSKGKNHMGLKNQSNACFYPCGNLWTSSNPFITHTDRVQE
nr:prolactin-releasing peptide receptor isoform X3 [Dromaius novaehollandiae]